MLGLPSGRALSLPGRHEMMKRTEKNGMGAEPKVQKFLRVFLPGGMKTPE